jgi:hypothetical protein
MRISARWKVFQPRTSPGAQFRLLLAGGILGGLALGLLGRFVSVAFTPMVLALLIFVSLKLYTLKCPACGKPVLLDHPCLAVAGMTVYAWVRPFPPDRCTGCGGKL